MRKESRDLRRLWKRKWTEVWGSLEWEKAGLELNLSDVFGIKLVYTYPSLSSRLYSHRPPSLTSSLMITFFQPP